jgi:hypothetical protein
MGDHATTNDPSNTTFENKGKGKDVQDQHEDDSSSEESDNENEEMVSVSCSPALKDTQDQPITDLVPL